MVRGVLHSTLYFIALCAIQHFLIILESEEEVKHLFKIIGIGGGFITLYHFKLENRH